MSILAPRDREALLSQGLLSPANSEGFTMIHKRRLNEFSDVEYEDLPLSPVSEAPEAFSTIPETLISLATVKYLGFNGESATQIWGRWVAKYPDSHPCIHDVSFVGAVTGFLGDQEQELDTWDEQDEKWIESMKEWGISQELQEAIMDPVFKDMRLNETLFFWLRDTIETRLAALKEMRRASRLREQQIQKAERP